MELNINNENFIVDKFDDESDKIYNERIDFVKKVYNDTKNFKEAINLSKIWLNFIYRDCRYNPEVYKKLNKYIN